MTCVMVSTSSLAQEQDASLRSLHSPRPGEEGERSFLLGQHLEQAGAAKHGDNAFACLAIPVQPYYCLSVGINCLRYFFLMVLL